MSAPKSCSTCEHCITSWVGREFSMCERAGVYCSMERKHPTECGQNYEGWQPRIGFFQRIARFFTGHKP